MHARWMLWLSPWTRYVLRPSFGVVPSGLLYVFVLYGSWMV